MLDRVHDGNRLAMLRIQKIQLPIADAVLAGAGATHAECAMDDVVIHALGFGEIGGVVRVNHNRQVKIAVTNVAEECNRNGCIG